MQKAMEDLGPCKDVVKKTMMECFSEMADSVREALGEQGDGLSRTETKAIGQTAGSCYERGLGDLAECMAENNPQEMSEDFDEP